MDATAFIIAAFVWGTIVGSFLNVVIWRWPQEKSLQGRSFCPHCHKTLTAQQLVPILSYLWQRGRCAQCGKKISPRYPIIEAVTGLLFAGAAAHFLMSGINSVTIIEMIRAWLIIAVLIVVFVIDLEHYLILNAVIWRGVVALLALNLLLDVLLGQSILSLHSHTLSGLLAALGASGLFYLLWWMSRGRWMGFGDVKLCLFLGLALGWPGIVVGLFLAFMIGAAFGLILIFLGTKQMSSRIPFGTFLSIGAILALFYAPKLSSWYMQLILGS